MLTVDIINQLDSDKEKLYDTLIFALDYITDKEIKDYIIDVLKEVSQKTN